MSHPHSFNIEYYKQNKRINFVLNSEYKSEDLRLNFSSLLVLLRQYHIILAVMQLMQVKWFDLEMLKIRVKLFIRLIVMIVYLPNYFPIIRPLLPILNNY